MISVTLTYGKNGVLKNCKANGHADFSKKGFDIVCSAVTVLLKTAGSLLSHMENVTFMADASSRGQLFFELYPKIDISEDKKESLETRVRLKCIADFIQEGIRSVQEEYPENVRLTLVTSADDC